MYHGRRAISRPSAPIADVMPVFVARSSARPGLQRPHRGDLVVLLRSERAAVPRVVGDVDEQRGVLRLRSDVGAEGVLVTDVDAHARAGDGERRRMRLAMRLARERDRQHPAHEPADDRLERNRFAKRDEMAFPIEVRRRRADARDAVVIARFTPGRERRLDGEEPDEGIAARARPRCPRSCRITASGISSANTGKALSGSTTSRPRLAVTSSV